MSSAQILSVHSYRGGTGKSNITANLAALIARRGLRVGVVDTDIQSPGIHVLFGWEPPEESFSLNDFLWGHCDIEQAAFDVTPQMVVEAGGSVFLIPSSIKTGEITRILREGFDPGLLSDGFQRACKALDLDLLIIDTHPGLNEETLLSIAISDSLVIVLRPDYQDYQGTGVTVDIAQRLNVPHMQLVLNKIPRTFDFEAVRSQVEAAYDCGVSAMLPHSDSMMALGSRTIFALEYPEHPITAALSDLGMGIFQGIGPEE
jgi:MinD-like ATPase involved in chromosome partitioning or flagellar assembly